MSVPLGSLVERVDALAGHTIEAVVRAKHQRRLERFGWPGALTPSDDGRWASGDPPPRDGCELDVLIDGAEAFAAISEAIEARGSPCT